MSNYDAIKDLWVERQMFLARTLVAAALCLIAFVALGLRLGYLQITQHEYYSTRSDDNRMRLVVVPPVRGLIYDRHGGVLAENTPAFVLEITPEQVKDLDGTLDRLGKLVRVSADDRERFLDRLRKTPRYRGVPLRTRLSLDELARYEVNRYRFPGVDATAGLTRNYPLGAAAAHVVGYVGGITGAELAQFSDQDYRGTNLVGKTGVEHSHESELHGALSTKIVETNAGGRPLRELEYRHGTPGKNLYLTLDARLQLAAYDALGDRQGAVAAIDPKTGEILALVSKPGVDPQLFVDGIDRVAYRQLTDDPVRPLFNRALQGQYPPGSAIKPLMAFTGLVSGTLDPNRRMFDPGYFQLPGSARRYRCWKRSGHGWVDMRRGIVESCDVYFYQVASDLGIDRIGEVFSEFGLGRPTGVDLPAEKGGLLPTRDWKRRAYAEPWYPGETLNIGVGQGYLTVTPLQLAQMTARIALRGRGYKPHVVHAIGDAPTGGLRVVPPEPLPPIAPDQPQDWDLLIAAMEAVAQTPHGTAYNACRDAPYRIAGKTGTAQVAGLSQEEAAAPKLADVAVELRDHAWFVAFAPADDPRIAVAVLAEHAGHGGAEAAPIARRIMDAYLLPAAPSAPSVTAAAILPENRP